MVSSLAALTLALVSVEKVLYSFLSFSTDFNNRSGNLLDSAVIVSFFLILKFVLHFLYRLTFNYIHKQYKYTDLKADRIKNKKR